MDLFRCGTCGSLNRVPPARRSETPKCGRCKEPLDIEAYPQEVNLQGLESTVSSSPVPVLVDFWAPWCGPCQAAAPVVESAANDRAGSLIVLKVNTDADPDAGSKYQVRGIPTFVLFHQGREIDRKTGFGGRADLDQWLARNARV